MPVRLSGSYGNAHILRKYGENILLSYPERPEPTNEAFHVGYHSEWVIIRPRHYFLPLFLEYDASSCWPATDHRTEWTHLIDMCFHDELYELEWKTHSGSHLGLFTRFQA